MRNAAILCVKESTKDATGGLLFFETADMSMAYQSGLTAQDSTDTLVAIARVGLKS